MVQIFDQEEISRLFQNNVVYDQPLSTLKSEIWNHNRHRTTRAGGSTLDASWHLDGNVRTEFHAQVTRGFVLHSFSHHPAPIENLWTRVQFQNLLNIWILMKICSESLHVWHNPENIRKPKFSLHVSKRSFRVSIKHFCAYKIQHTTVGHYLSLY